MRVVTEEGSFEVETVSPVWSLGWQWPWGILLAGMIGGNFLFAADQAVIGMAALVGGPGITVAGVRAVNRHSGAALAEGARRVRRAVATELDQDVSAVYSLAEGVDSAYGLERSKRYDLTVLTLGETALTIHHDVMVDLLDTSWLVGDRTEQVPYERLSSVTGDSGTLQMELVDGETISVPTERRPVELTTALDSRLD